MKIDTVHRHRVRIVVLQQFGASQIPHLYGSIVTARRDQGAVRVETHGVDETAMIEESVDTFRAPDVPQFNRFVVPARHGHQAIRAKTCRTNPMLVAFQSCRETVFWNVPNLASFIRAGSNHKSFIGRKRHTLDGGSVGLHNARLSEVVIMLHSVSKDERFCPWKRMQEVPQTERIERLLRAPCDRQ
eukprot:59986_1